ncbi:MAG: hypothetical protein HOP11_06825 [Saprospiraceae bacterium]|nr:hypothetical protein [Saprospiraceae bacterium]
MFRRLYLTLPYLTLPYLTLLNFTLILNCHAGGFGMPSPIQIEDVQINFPGIGVITAERYVTCKNLNCFLAPNEPDNPDKCYNWTVREINTPQVEVNCPLPPSYTINACKESALYLVRVYDKKNPQNPISYYAFIVYVIEDISLSEVNNVTECFDEMVDLNFRITLHGKGFSELKTTHELLKLEQTALSPAIYSKSVLVEMKNFNSEIRIKIKVPEMGKDVQFTTKDNNKNYKLQTVVKFINDDACSSNKIQIEVYRLWIEIFKHAGTDHNGNTIEPAPDNWMVVMNYDIECKIYPEHMINNVDISLGDLWGELDFGKNLDPSSKILRINELKANHNIFKSVFVFGTNSLGIVRVKARCKDGKEREVTSDKTMEWIEGIILGSGKWLTIKRFMTPGVTTKIYFSKEATSIFDPEIPNWYIYWNEFCAISEEAENTNEFYKKKPLTQVPKQIHYGANTIFVEYPTLIHDIYYYDACKCKYTVTEVFGVHGFYTVNYHEHLHAKIYQQRWPNGVVDPNNDKDYDAIPDDFESSEIGEINGFNLTIVDGAWDYKNNISSNNDIDSDYQHYYLRIEENSKIISDRISNNPNVIDYLDWSYNPIKSFCQGKQWKK